MNNYFHDINFPETAVYDSIRTYGKKPFHLQDHLKRLENSAKLLGFELPESRESISQKVLKEIDATDFDPQFLKIIATPKNIFLENRPLRIDPSVYEGVKVLSVTMSRGLVKCKRVRSPGLEESYQQALSIGYYEALLKDPHQYLTEGTRSNILWIESGRLHYCDHALTGITQAEIIKIAEKLSITVSQGVLPYHHLKTIDELFLTQTTRGVVPILTVDHIEIGDGKAGEQTKLFMSHYQKMTSS